MLGMLGTMERWRSQAQALYCDGRFSLYRQALGCWGSFVTFRHWSQIEADKTFYNLTPKCKIDFGENGNINVEVAIACCFILIFAPVVFEQLQVADPHSLSLKGHPSAFAFGGFMLVEVIKIAPIVQYYDVYADILSSP